VTKQTAVQECATWLSKFDNVLLKSARSVLNFEHLAPLFRQLFRIRSKIRLNLKINYYGLFLKPTIII